MRGMGSVPGDGPHSFSGRSSNGQTTDSDAVFIEDDDATGPRSLLHCRKIGKEQGDLLFRTPTRVTAKKDDRGLGAFAFSEQRAEVGIRGNEDAVFYSGASEQGFIVAPLHAKLA